MKKKILSGLLSGVMLLSALNGVPALAAPGEVPPKDEIPAAGETGEPVPYSDNVYSFDGDIEPRSFSWPQAMRYFHIEIKNTSDIPITCSLTTPKIPTTGDLTGDIVTFAGIVGTLTVIRTMLNRIEPGTTVTVNNNYYAQPGEYTLSFAYSTSECLYPGTIHVDTSNSKFPD